MAKRAPEKLFHTELDHEHDAEGAAANQGLLSLRQQQQQQLAQQLLRDSQNVENEMFEFSPSGPTNLPANVNLAMVMENVVAQMPFSSAVDREAFRRQFLDSPETALIIKDFYWYVFCREFRDKPAGQTTRRDRNQNGSPNRKPPPTPSQEPTPAVAAEMNKLMKRLGETYVRLLLSVGEEHHDSDKFFQKFPDSVAQVTHASFKQAYPVSSSRFGDSFRLALVDTCYNLTTGLKQSRPQLGHWKADTRARGGATGARGRPAAARLSARMNTMGAKAVAPEDERAQARARARARRRKKARQNGAAAVGGAASRKRLARLTQRRLAAESSVRGSTPLFPSTREVRTKYELGHSPLVGQYLHDRGAWENSKLLSMRLTLTENSARPLVGSRIEMHGGGGGSGGGGGAEMGPGERLRSSRRRAAATTGGGGGGGRLPQVRASSAGSHRSTGSREGRAGECEKAATAPVGGKLGSGKARGEGAVFGGSEGPQPVGITAPAGVRVQRRRVTDRDAAMRAGMSEKVLSMTYADVVTEIKRNRRKLMSDYQARVRRTQRELRKARTAVEKQAREIDRRHQQVVKSGEMDDFCSYLVAGHKDGSAGHHRLGLTAGLGGGAAPTSTEELADPTTE